MDDIIKEMKGTPRSRPLDAGTLADLEEERKAAAVRVSTHDSQKQDTEGSQDKDKQQGNMRKSRSARKEAGRRANQKASKLETMNEDALRSG